MNTDAFIAGDHGLAAVRSAEETVWINPRLLPFDVVDGLSQLVVSDDDIADTAARLRRSHRVAAPRRPCDAETAFRWIRGTDPGASFAEDGQPSRDCGLGEGARRDL